MYGARLLTYIVKADKSENTQTARVTDKETHTHKFWWWCSAGAQFRLCQNVQFKKIKREKSAVENEKNETRKNEKEVYGYN